MWLLGWGRLELRCWPGPPSLALSPGKPLYNQPPFQTDTSLLLTDGTVMMHEYATPNWWRLTPDNSGSCAKASCNHLLH
jgi:hypothetical protein